MAQVQSPEEYCKKCIRFSGWGKYSCKTCRVMYTSNFKLKPEFDWKYQKKVQRKERIQSSDERLRTLYSRIKELYFGGNYIPDASQVSFMWKRGMNGGGTCWKKLRLIKIGGAYGPCFTSLPSPYWSRKSLVALMIHEATHLRLAHHRKSFKMKVAEVEAKVQESDMEKLFEGLYKV